MIHFICKVTLNSVLQQKKSFLFDRQNFATLNKTMNANPNTSELIDVMNSVYGEFDGPNWKPKPYAENKSRYLWTDAFGVCNYITLYYETADQKFLNQAECLIRDVHNTLGKDRTLQRRLGASTDANPLLGGLRIGKADPEGTPDGDGQYFHYLTKWMFVLNRMSIAKGDQHYNDWAIQLATSIHDHFVYDTSSHRPRMYWKMSIDLSHPEVHSEGNLDPFDGYITYRLLRDRSTNKNVLSKQISDMEKIVRAKYKYYSSEDPLDLGEALWIAHFYVEEDWATFVTTKSLEGLEKLWRMGYFAMPLRYRLAFREFGTTIGVQVNKKAGKEWAARAQKLHECWKNHLYTRDKDITPIMYGTSLVPGVFGRDYKAFQ